MEKKRVLIFPAGAENALEIYDALKFNVNVEVFGASGKKDCAEFEFDENHYIEAELYINKDNFIENLNDLIRKNSIDVIIPTHDDISLYLAKHVKEINCNILTSAYETAEVCRKKKKTFEIFKEDTFCPKVYVDKSKVSETDLPLYAKPNESQGAIGARIIDNIQKLDSVNSDDVLCEYLPGEEYTVDCFTNRKRELIFVGPRTRDRIVMGIAFRSSSVELTEEILTIAKTINERMPFFGAWYFQLKKSNDGILKLMEISCRQAGTMTLYRHMGVNFPLLGIFELYGVDTSYVLAPGKWIVERRLKSKFKNEISFDKVYVDYDDTVIVNDNVNVVLLAFLYKCVNEKKKLFLLTRHEGDLEESMRVSRISSELFDCIITLTFEEDKCDFIDPKGSILIDNSFTERKKVFERFGIPVFDVDAIDAFL